MHVVYAQFFCLILSYSMCHSSIFSIVCLVFLSDRVKVTVRFMHVVYAQLFVSFFVQFYVPEFNFFQLFVLYF